MMMVNGFQFAYFINSITNGDLVGVKKRVRKSPVGMDVTIKEAGYQRDGIAWSV